MQDAPVPADGVGLAPFELMLAATVFCSSSENDDATATIASDAASALTLILLPLLLQLTVLEMRL